MRLGILEKKILASLLVKREAEVGIYPDKGNDEFGIHQIVFGSHSPYKNLSIIEKERSSLSRALNNLYRKGLVKKGKPQYHYKWHKKDEYLSGYYGKDFHLKLEITENGEHTEIITLPEFTKLPKRTRYWWMLTEKGKHSIEDKGQHEDT